MANSTKYPNGYYRLLTPENFAPWRSTTIGKVNNIHEGTKLPDDPFTEAEDILCFRVPLVNELEVVSASAPSGDEPTDFEDEMPEDMTDVTIDLKVGVRYREHNPAESYKRETSPRITFMIAEHKCADPAPADATTFPHAVGFQIRDPREFVEWGPYRGVESKVLEHDVKADPDFEGVLKTVGRVGYLPDDRGDLGAIEYLHEESQAVKSPIARTPAQIPEVIEMTLKPNAYWGRCASSVAGGHSISVAPFFNSVDISAGLYLDVYFRKPGRNYYEIMFVEVRINYMS